MVRNKILIFRITFIIENYASLNSSVNNIGIPIIIACDSVSTNIILCVWQEIGISLKVLINDARYRKRSRSESCKLQVIDFHTAESSVVNFPCYILLYKRV